MGVRAVAVTLVLGTMLMPASAAATYRGLQGVTVRWEACPTIPEAEGCVIADDLNTVYVRERGNMATLHHELGHIWDLRTLNDADRGWFRPLLGYKERVPWWGPGRSVADFPAERFADAAALCMEGVRVRPFGEAWLFASNYTPTMRRQRRICNAISALDMVRG